MTSEHVGELLYIMNSLEPDPPSKEEKVSGASMEFD